MSLTLRAMEAGDLAAVQALANSLREATHWSHEAWLAAIAPESSPRRICMVASEADTLAGFAVFSRLPPEAELESIAVAAEFQKKGLGRELFRAGIAALHRTGVTTVFLEVRASNQPALALYGRMGFRQGGRRRSYYTDPTEDALLLHLDLANTVPNFPPCDSNHQ